MALMSVKKLWRISRFRIQKYLDSIKSRTWMISDEGEIVGCLPLF
jgi:hypothetical protein